MDDSDDDCRTSVCNELVITASLVRPGLGVQTDPWRFKANCQTGRGPEDVCVCARVCVFVCVSVWKGGR